MGGGFEPPNPPSRYATVATALLLLLLFSSHNAYKVTPYTQITIIISYTVATVLNWTKLAVSVVDACIRGVASL